MVGVYAGRKPKYTPASKKPLHPPHVYARVHTSSINRTSEVFSTMSTRNQYGIELSVSDPYNEGHALTAIEAEALNGLRSENISHLIRGWIKSENGLNIADPKSHEFTADEIKQIKEKVQEFDKTYEFGMGGGGRTLDPVTKEARRIARDAVDLKLIEKGKTKAKRGEAPGPDQISHENYVELVNELSTRPGVIKSAKAIVERAKNAGDGLEINIV